MRKGAIDFFYEHAGYSWNPRTETPDEGRRATARMLAEAEAEAWDRGWSCTWTSDTDRDLSWHDDPEEVESVEVCTLRDERGEVFGSLGGIVDASREYRRVIEAELAADALAAVRDDEHAGACLARMAPLE